MLPTNIFFPTRSCIHTGAHVYVTHWQIPAAIGRHEDLCGASGIMVRNASVLYIQASAAEAAVAAAHAALAASEVFPPHNVDIQATAVAHIDYLSPGWAGSLRRKRLECHQYGEACHFLTTTKQRFNLLRQPILD